MFPKSSGIVRGWARRKDVQELGLVGWNGVQPDFANHAPDCLRRPLKVNRLDAEEGQWQALCEEPEGDGAIRQCKVHLQQVAETAVLLVLELVGLHKFQIEDLLRLPAQNVGEAPGHPRSEVQSHRAEHGDNSASHVLASVLPDSFDDRYRAAIANSETLTGLTRNVEVS